MLGKRGKAGMPAVAAVSAPFGRDLENCFRRIERIVRRCRERGAELVVFPEAALGGSDAAVGTRQTHVKPVAVPATC